MALTISFLCAIVVMWGYILHNDLNAIRRCIERKNEKDGDGE